MSKLLVPSMVPYILHDVTVFLILVTCCKQCLKTDNYYKTEYMSLMKSKNLSVFHNQAMGNLDSTLEAKWTAFLNGPDTSWAKIEDSDPAKPEFKVV